MKISNLYTLKISIYSLCVCTLFACSAQKDTAASTGLQNLTARYNYIYNANIRLLNYQAELNDTYHDNYDQLLPVYIGPQADITKPSLKLKEMDDIIKKSQFIILEKSHSNYLDEAYILLGKANFFNGSYFIASEYLEYAAKAYRTNINSYAEALAWNARSLMQINKISAAKTKLDSLEAILPQVRSKNNLADLLATMAQINIYQNDDTAAISRIKNAIKSGKVRQNNLRWTYILAQLYERQKNYSDASIQYEKVVKSNAPFEMYFNAKLSQIRLNTDQGEVIDKKALLLALLKDDKNIEHSNHVHYQIAEILAESGAYRDAEQSYLTAIQTSTSDQNKKGLSYLNIAEINFKFLRNYLKAKIYYDSAVTTLPKSHPGYDLILKKSANLQFLTQRYEIISLEDTLQAMAKLPQAEQLRRIQNFVSSDNLEKAIGRATLDYNHQLLTNKNAAQQTTFYFSNPSAVTSGYFDFKKKWGNRRLEANWRQSIKPSSQARAQDIVGTTSSSSAIQQYSPVLLATGTLLTASNQKIIDAYYEIANFYLQELNDSKEAEEIYSTLIRRFPSNNHLDAVLYSLYLINKTADIKQAETYKNQILLQFPNSIYAKTITSPFAIKESETESTLDKKYNLIFDQFLKKEFTSVIHSVSAFEKLQENYLSPQLTYLKAIAIGRNYPVDSLLNALNRIIRLYPNDQLITPLSQQHIVYINQHLQEYKNRKVALVDFDPTNPPFTGKTSSQPIIVQQGPLVAQSIAPAQAIKAPESIKIEGIFTKNESTVYYFIVDVSDASLTLSSSRFGIGQFNRGNYAGSNLRHQLKEFDNDQLIFIGNFSSFEDARNYANGIVPQLKQIMKVPVNLYTSFIISKENFDKLNNKALLDKYMEFYKNSY